MIYTEKTKPFVPELPLENLGKIAFIGAHPDDIVLQAHTLAQARALDLMPTVITATPGTESSLSPRFAFQGLRPREERTALHSYGIAPQDQIQLWLPDTQLSTPRMRQRLAQQVAAHAILRNVQTVCTLGTRTLDSHPDHIASHAVAIEAAKIVAAKRKLPLLVLGLVEAPDAEYMIQGSGEDKVRLALAYPSQFGTSHQRAEDILAHTYDDPSLPEFYARAA